MFNQMKAGFFHSYFETMFSIAEWALAHPKAYFFTALPVMLATVMVGANFGDWSLIGAVKFWLASTMFSLVCSIPSFLLAKELTY